MSIPSQPPKETVLIVNLRSRLGSAGINRVREALEGQGIKVKRAIPVHSPRHIPKLVKAAVNSDEKLVVVGGGDGTIAAAADPLAFADTTLGILPLGTGNDFARALGIPLDLEGACRVLAEGKIARVNLAHVNGDYFVNMASVGFTAQISHLTPEWLKRTFGLGAYILGAFTEFWLSRPFHVNLTVDGEKHQIETPLVIIWNGRFHAGWDLAADEVEENKLIIYAPAAPSRVHLVQMALSLKTGHLIKAPPLLALSADHVLIEAKPPQEVDVDGEVLHRTPIFVQLAPRALRVVTPQTFKE